MRTPPIDFSPNIFDEDTMSKELRATRPAGRSIDRRMAAIRRPQLEALESRELMAVDFTSAKGLLLGTTLSATGTLPDLSVAIGNDGSTYLAGTFRGALDLNSGAANGKADSAGGEDIFVVKYNANGGFAWLKTYGAAGDDVATGIALGGASNSQVYVVGTFKGSVNFNKAGSAVLSTNGQNRYDGFVLKLGTDGSFGYATQFAGPSQNANGAQNLPTTVAADAAGNAYVGGRFQKSSTFGGTTLTANSQSYDGFVAKLGSGGAVAWAVPLTPSPTGSSWVKGIAVDNQGNVLTTGQFNGVADFNPGAGVDYRSTPSSATDAFVWKLSPAGAEVWAKQAGGPGRELGEGIAVDQSNNAVYITGKYTSVADSSGKYPLPIDFDPGSGNFPLWSRKPNQTDVFVWKLDSGGNFGWARGMNIINDANDPGRGGIAVQPGSGDVIVGGSFVNVSPTDNRGNDVFVTEFSPQGTVIGLRSGGGSGTSDFGAGTVYNDNIVQGLAVNANGVVAVAGMNRLPNATFGNNSIAGDGFVAKLQADNVKHTAPDDFDGDGKTDTVVYDVYTSRFYLSMSSLGNVAIQFGPGSNDGAKPTPIVGDYDGDGRADPAVFDAVHSNFYLSRSTRGNVAIQFGPGTADGADPVPAVADYDGDGKTDPSVLDRKTSTFYLARSSAGNIPFQFGPGTNDGANPEPVPADYSGDGKADPAVFDANTSTFAVAGWSGNTPVGRYIRQFGPANATPVVADYDGDGKADPAVYVAGSSTFYITRSTLGFPAGNIAFQFGPGGSTPIVADYSGDGKADPAVFNAATGEFCIAGWNGNTPVGRSITQFGAQGSGGADLVPLIGDFDGDGKYDIASFDRKGANFYITQSSLGSAGNRSYQFGQGTSYGGAPIPQPIPNYLLLTRKWV